MPIRKRKYQTLLHKKYTRVTSIKDTPVVDMVLFCSFRSSKECDAVDSKPGDSPISSVKSKEELKNNQ